MARDVDRFLRIQKPVAPTRTGADISWKTLPNCDKLPVWEVATAKRVDGDKALHIFHVPHVPSVVRGHRVQYLGQQFTVAEVSNSPKLLGLELRCEALP